MGQPGPTECEELETLDPGLYVACESKCQNPSMNEADPCSPYCDCYEDGPLGMNTLTKKMPQKLKEEIERIKNLMK